jgi:site-specific DNA-methyltransferase (adenine-specific)
MDLKYETGLGRLFQADCVELLRSIASGTVTTFFADPPFNLDKNYGPESSDSLSAERYLQWSREWLTEAIRTLAPGGALFLYNLPKWLIPLGTFLMAQSEMTFKHWIAVEKAHSLPIPNRLSTSHYGMLYFIKGERPRVFDRDAVRIPIKTCRHCGRDIKDYGGHKKFLNTKGLNIGDIWVDIPPVRHKKYKSRGANELAPVLLERVIRLSTKPGDLVCDPFAGGGTTAYVAEKLRRTWISGDIGDCEPIRIRLTDLANGSDPEWKSTTKSFQHKCEPVENFRLTFSPS